MQMQGFMGFGCPFLTVVATRQTLNIARLPMLGCAIGLVNPNGRLAGIYGDALGRPTYFETWKEAETAAVKSLADLP